MKFKIEFNVCQGYGIAGIAGFDDVGKVDGHPTVDATYPAVSIQTILKCDPDGRFALTEAREALRLAPAFVPGGHNV